MAMQAVVPINFKVRMEDQLRAVLEGLPIAVSWASVEDGTVLFVNRKYHQLLGYTKADHPTVADFLEHVVLDKSWAREAAEMTRELLQGPHLEDVELPPTEVEVLCKDRSRKHVLISATILHELGWLLTTTLDITDQRARETLVRSLAEQEPLTGLLNRRAFETVLDEMLGSQHLDEENCLLMLDLENFKAINDHHGHLAGDKVLVRTAARIRKAIRSQDLLARWGGDEFTVLLPRPGDRSAVEEVVRRIKLAVNRPIWFEGTQLEVGISAGAAFFPADAMTSADLLQVADERMYADKKKNRCSHRARPPEALDRTA